MFTKENEDFQEKILSRSGLGNRTYFPLCRCSPERAASGKLGDREN